MHVQLLVASTLKVWEGKKRPKFIAIYDNFWLWSWIFLEQIKTSPSSKLCYQLQFFECWK